MLALALGAVACSRQGKSGAPLAASTTAPAPAEAAKREEPVEHAITPSPGTVTAPAKDDALTPTPPPPRAPTKAPAADPGVARGPAAVTAPARRAPSKPETSARAEADEDRGVGAFGAGAGGGRAAARPAPLHDGFGAPAAFAGVKAGEWDDNANYREFMRFLGSSGVPFKPMDLRDRRFLVVRDSLGHAVPRCKVTVSGGQSSATFVTTASGRAILFPRAEGLLGEKLTASAACAEGTTTASFALGSNEPDGIVDLRLGAPRNPITSRTVDVAFVLDTTGSMAEEISAVKTTIQKVAQVLSTNQTQVRIGLVEYKDRTDAFVTKVYPFSSNLAAFAQSVAQIEAGGGGDTPEDMNAGLHAAVSQLQWSDQSVARLAFVIADAPPHLDYDGPSYVQDTKAAAHRGIQLFTVAASGMDGLGQVVFRQMAQYTGATNMFVLRGGAGPQSTGGGDPGSSCGGTHTNYASGKLDELIVQKIRRELRALDADPMRIAGLKADENAKPCDQRVVWVD